MPLIMRILFGKMLGKIGRKTAGRSKSDVRRSVVLRFISSCNNEEIFQFLNLAFEPLMSLIAVNYGNNQELERAIDKSIDVSKFIPLGKLQAMLSTLESTMELLANTKPEILPFILKVINITQYMVVRLLRSVDEERFKYEFEQISHGAINRLRNLRRQCYELLTKFFDLFEYYPFNQNEIEFVFSQFIWPSLPHFHDQSYATPAPLLRLFLAWSENSRFFPLFLKYQNDNKSPTKGEESQFNYPLKQLIDLYCLEKTERPILSLIARILSNILNPDDPQDQDQDSIDNQVRVDRINDSSIESNVEMRDMLTSQNKNELLVINLNKVRIPEFDVNLFKIEDLQHLKLHRFGHLMLMRFIPQILNRLQLNCRKTVDCGSSKFYMESYELQILSTLCQYVRDPETSQVCASLLLKSLESVRSEELQLETSQAIKVLIEQVDEIDDTTFVPSIGRLLSYLRGINLRLELCSLLEIVAKKRENLRSIAKIMVQYNSRSHSIPENVDYEMRIKGFEASYEFLDTSDSRFDMNVRDELNSILLLVYQNIYYINTADQQDFTVRDASMVFFEKLASRLGRSKNIGLFKVVADELLLGNAIKKGLRNTSETVRHLYIGILRSLSIECREKRRVLHSFYQLCDESNPDLDFWLCVKHIQIHYRSKALGRLCGGGKSQEILLSLPSKVLSSYFLPLASSFLYNKTFIRSPALIDNAIKLIGLICKNVDWITFKNILTYHLHLLTTSSEKHQKTCVKLITEILGNFNFDLSSCEDPEIVLNRNAEEVIERRISNRQIRRTNLADPNFHRSRKEEGAQSDVITAKDKKKLNATEAQKIYSYVTQKLLLDLKSCLSEMTRVEFQHDKHMDDHLSEKDEIKRIPIAFAIVQLLNLLPGRRVLLKNQLPSIFLRLCSFLKSKSDSVRVVARTTLTKCLQFLGADYFPALLRELRQTLQKGFQIHVLMFTIHSVLSKLPLAYGDLDDQALDLMHLAMEELFGPVSEDKEIAQILAKTPEAKQTKSYDTLMLVSSVISQKVLEQFMLPIREKIKTCIDSKQVAKLSQCVAKIYTGLSQNNLFPLDKMLRFIRICIEDSIPSLKATRMIELAQKFDHNTTSISHTACGEGLNRYLLEKDLPRDRVKSKINEKGNYHILVENSLRLLLHTMTRNQRTLAKIVGANKSSIVDIKKSRPLQRSKNNLSAFVEGKSRDKKKYRDHLDVFVKLLSTCLKSKSPKSVSRALRCIYFIAKTQPRLENFKLKSKTIVKRLFILLSRYNGVGMGQGDNHEMIMMCFRTLNLLLVRCDNSFRLNKNQLAALLSYIEQDIHDSLRQSTALKTLKTILMRRFDAKELVDIMTKVSQLMIQSSDDTCRQLSSKLWRLYLVNYQHGKNNERLVDLMLTFVRQLEYPYVEGRITILNFLNNSLFDVFSKVYHQREVIFMLLASRLVNEDSSNARHLVGTILVKFIEKLSLNDAREVLNNMVMTWSTDTDNLLLRTMGIKLISVFLETNESLRNKLLQDSKRCGKKVTTTKKSQKIIKFLQIIEQELEFCSSSNYVCGGDSSVIDVSSKNHSEFNNPEEGNQNENDIGEINKIKSCYNRKNTRGVKKDHFTRNKVDSTNEDSDDDVEIVESSEVVNDLNKKNAVCDIKENDRIIGVKDRHLYHILRLFDRMLKYQLVDHNDKEQTKVLSKIWQQIANECLLHWYLPVSMSACRLYVQLLISRYSTSQIAQAINEGKSRKQHDYVLRSAKQIVANLSNQLILLMDRLNGSEEISEDVTRLLAFLGHVTLDLTTTYELEARIAQSLGNSYEVLLSNAGDDGFKAILSVRDQMGYKKQLDFPWLLRKMIMQARKEVALKRFDNFHRRSCVFKWCSAMLLKMSADNNDIEIIQQQNKKPKILKKLDNRAKIYAYAIILPLARELTDQSKNKDCQSERRKLLKLAEDSIEFMKNPNVLGRELFNKLYSSIQHSLSRKRIMRKKEIAEMRVFDPIRGVKRKLNQRKVKAVTKKRKISKHRAVD